ncbi:unnamed protein product [Ectocarpus sp. CCAP 1310/34]|nr:unnamed protein product [Ectocarpus sp. CCAP 1310/34]
MALTTSVGSPSLPSPAKTLVAARMHSPAFNWLPLPKHPRSLAVSWYTWFLTLFATQYPGSSLYLVKTSCGEDTGGPNSSLRRLVQPAGGS